MSLLSIPKNYRGPLIVAVLFHFALAMIFFLKISSSHYRWSEHVASSEPSIVHATTVDAAQLTQQMHKIKFEQETKQRQEVERLRRLEQKALAYKHDRLLEERRLKEVQLKQQQLNRQQIAQAKALRQQQKEEQLARQKALAWKKKVNALKKQELAQQQERLQQKLLQQQMHEEQKKIHQTTQQLSKIDAARLDGLADEFRAKILQTIENNWHPLVQNPKLSCQLLVRLAPGGVVTGVELIKSSGDLALDRSARLAILKASPLPVPKDQALFDRFRAFRIKMSPQDIKGMG